MVTRLENVRSFQEMYNTIRDAHGGISFFGVRYAYLKNNQGLHLDTILSATMQLLRKNPHFDEVERDFGKKLVQKIDAVRSEAKLSAEKRNFITRFFYMIAQCWITNFRIFDYGVRFKWIRERNFPDLYTKQQYENLNGFSPPETGDSYKPDLPTRWKLHRVTFKTSLGGHF